MRYSLKIILVSLITLGMMSVLGKSANAYPIPVDCSHVIQDQASCEALGITQWIPGNPVHGDISTYHVCEVLTSNELDPYPYEITVEAGIRLKGNGLFYLEPGLDPACIPAAPVNGLTLKYSAADGINIDMTTITGYRGVFVQCSGMKNITVDGGWLGYEFFGGGFAHNIQSRNARYSGVQMLAKSSVAATGVSVLNPEQFGATQFPQSVATILSHDCIGCKTGYLQKNDAFATFNEYSATDGMMGLTSQGASFVAATGDIANNSQWGAHVYDEGVVDLNDVLFERGQDMYASDGAEIRFSPGEVQYGADAISQASLASIEVPVEGSSNLFDFFREGGELLGTIFKGLLATIGVDGQIISPQLVSEITVAPAVDADIAALASEGLLMAEPEGVYTSTIGKFPTGEVVQDMLIEKATTTEIVKIEFDPSVVAVEDGKVTIVGMVRSTAELGKTLDAQISKLADPSLDVQMDALLLNPGNTKAILKHPVIEMTEKEERAAKKTVAMKAKSAMSVEHANKKIEMEAKLASPLALESIFSKLDESDAVLSSITVTLKEIENAVWSNKKLSAAVEPLFDKSEDMDSGILQPISATEMDLSVTKGDVTDSRVLDMTKTADLIRLDVDELIIPFTYPYGGRIGCALVGAAGREACSEETAIRVFDRDCSQGLLPWEAIAVCEDQGNEYDEGLDGDRRIFTILSKLSVIDLVIEDQGKYAKHPINMDNKDSWIMNVHQYGPPPEDTDLE